MVKKDKKQHKGRETLKAVDRIRKAGGFEPVRVGVNPDPTEPSAVPLSAAARTLPLPGVPNTPTAPVAERPVTLSVRAPASEVQRWRVAMALSGCTSVQDWASRELARAARREIERSR